VKHKLLHYAIKQLYKRPKLLLNAISSEIKKLSAALTPWINNLNPCLLTVERPSNPAKFYRVKDWIPLLDILPTFSLY